MFTVEADMLVNVLAAGVVAPIIVPSILPPFISAVLQRIVSKKPSAMTLAPIIVPSILPPLISTVANVDKPATPKVPSALIFPVVAISPFEPFSSVLT